jgi:hypothetical protein
MTKIFAIFVFLVVVAQGWVLKREYDGLSKLQGFAPHERIVLRNQVLSAVLILGFGLAFLTYLLGLKYSFAIFGLSLPLLKAGMLVADAGVLFISISSIRNRVSMIRPRAKKTPSKGTSALVFGVIFLVASIVLLGFIYFLDFPYPSS